MAESNESLAGAVILTFRPLSQLPAVEDRGSRYELTYERRPAYSLPPRIFNYSSPDSGLFRSDYSCCRRAA